MTKKSIKSFLEDNQGYLKWGKRKLARKFGTTQNVIAEIKQEIRGGSINPKGFKRLYFDIETSPNIGWFWRATWKTAIKPHQIREERKVICISYKWEGEDKVYNLKWDRNKSDEGMLKEFSKVMAQADEVIAHNGDRFDIPWLRTRCLFFGIPFPTYVKSLDTLKKVKSMFNFQSNRLDYVANFLGFGHKIDIGPEVWEKVVFVPTDHKEYKDAMAEMLEYCDYDVVLLEDVFKKIESYIKPSTHVGVHQGKDKCTCPKCGNEDVKYVKATVTSAGSIKRIMSCPEHGDYAISNTAYKQFLEKNGN